MNITLIILIHLSLLAEGVFFLGLGFQHIKGKEYGWAVFPSLVGWAFLAAAYIAPYHQLFISSGT